MAPTQRIFVTGPRGTGKTTLIQSVVDDTYRKSSRTHTEGFEDNKVVLDGQKLIITEWGSDKTHDDVYFDFNHNEPAAIVVVYDTTNESTLETAKEEVDYYQKNYPAIPITLVGTKSLELVSIDASGTQKTIQEGAKLAEKMGVSHAVTDETAAQSGPKAFRIALGGKRIIQRDIPEKSAPEPAPHGMSNDEVMLSIYGDTSSSSTYDPAKPFTHFMTREERAARIALRDASYDKYFGLPEDEILENGDDEVALQEGEPVEQSGEESAYSYGPPALATQIAGFYSDGVVVSEESEEEVSKSPASDVIKATQSRNSYNAEVGVGSAGLLMTGGALIAAGVIGMLFPTIAIPVYLLGGIAAAGMTLTGGSAAVGTGRAVYHRVTVTPSVLGGSAEMSTSPVDSTGKHAVSEGVSAAPQATSH